MTYLLIPVFILAAIVVLFGIAAFLGRFRNGRYLRPIIALLTKVPWIRRQFQKVSEAALERQNPDLAAATKKLQRLGANPDPKRVQQAISQLPPAERRAYFAYIGEMQEQGAGPEPANRQLRRAQQRFQQGTRPPAGRSGNPSKANPGKGSAGKRGKKR